MEYHVVLAFLYDELIGKCMKCSEYVEYISCLQFLCDFIESRNQQKLQNDVFSGKWQEIMMKYGIAQKH